MFYFFQRKSKAHTYTAANKYYSSDGHHELKNKKTTGQIKFSMVTRKQ